VFLGRQRAAVVHVPCARMRSKHVFALLQLCACMCMCVCVCVGLLLNTYLRVRCTLHITNLLGNSMHDAQARAETAPSRDVYVALATAVKMKQKIICTKSRLLATKVDDYALTRIRTRTRSTTCSGRIVSTSNLQSTFVCSCKNHERRAMLHPHMGWTYLEL
jgi:hypothetical protein